MTRVFNFSAGPATMPQAVLAQAQSELTGWRDSGMSVMEMSHRGEHFTQIAAEAEQDLRQLLSVPDNYSVLFLQGGATLQFAMTVLNLAAPGDSVDYAVTGSWGKKAVAEASRFANVNVAADGAAYKYCDIPPFDTWQLSNDAAYLHFTPNETIGGVEYHTTPIGLSRAPLVADFSSSILSRPINVADYGLIYAGAQKNIGPSGLTLVIVREDLLGPRRGDIPTMMQYQTHAAAGSMSNTPPTFAWYLAGLTFKWLQSQGGLAAMARINQKKAETLYAAIDQSSFYSCPVARQARSRMNVPFVLADSGLDKAFLEQAGEAGLVSLKGHRSVGGMRASLYNAMTQEGVDALVTFMADFERREG
ncbi:MAG: 3-phosphoserine/phosphohydroxythreonine transaminase [Pseudomonadota bacterium]